MKREARVCVQGFKEAALEQPVEFAAICSGRKITKVPMYLSLTFALLLVSAFLSSLYEAFL